MNQKISTKRIAMAGLLAALTAVGSGLRIVIPVSIGGNSAFHLGNIFCALCGILLGPWLGGLAAGLGSAIYDMLKNGCEVAREQAAQTLDEVRRAMKINYFDDAELIAEQARKFKAE